jgi:hypothetical protein
MIFRHTAPHDCLTTESPAAPPADRPFGIRDLLADTASRIQVRRNFPLGLKIFASCAAFAILLSAGVSARAAAPMPRAEVSKSEIVQLLKSHGYSEILVVPSTSSKGEWMGSAFKDGERMPVTVDAAGRITSR